MIEERTQGHCKDQQEVGNDGPGLADQQDGAEELLDIEEEGDHNTNRYLMIDGESAAKTSDNCCCEGTQQVNCRCEGGGDGDSSYIDIAVSGVMFGEMLNVGLGAVIGLRYADACQLLFQFRGDDTDNGASLPEGDT